MILAEVRPRSVTEIIDATFNFYRGSFATCIALTMIILGPPAVLKVIVPASWQRIVEIGENFLVPIATGAIAAVVISVLERNESPNVASALQRISGRQWTLIGIQFLSGVMILAGLILLVVPGVIAMVWTAVSIPSAIAEGFGAVRAIGRSRRLVRGRWGAALGTLILSWGLTFLLMVGVSVVVGMLDLSERAIAVCTDMCFIALLPIPAIALTLLYYDLRIRAEGADIEAMASALPNTTPAT